MYDKRETALMRSRAPRSAWDALRVANTYVKDAGYVLPVDRLEWFAARRVA